MRIRDLNLLPKHYQGDWYSGMDKIGSISWGDLLLKEINGDKLILLIRPGLEEAGREIETSFKKREYSKLNDEEKTKLNNIFKNNIGKIIKGILDLDFT